MILTHIKEELGQCAPDNGILSSYHMYHNIQKQFIIMEWPDKGPEKILRDNSLQCWGIIL